MIPPISWMSKAARWAWRMLNAPREIDRLQGKLASLEASAPPRPRDMRLMHSIYWGIPEGGSTPVGYCTACASQGVYVPLKRIIRDANGEPRKEVIYRCPKCGQLWLLNSAEEREALGS